MSKNNPSPAPAGPAPSGEPSPDSKRLQAGTLYLVATPIGNLEDITLRAIRTLQQCDLVAAEDTRRTGVLLHHLGIKKPMLSCHQFNEMHRAEQMLQKLQAGQTVALVSDAGSPGISDPGERLVRLVLAAGIRVEPVPGPCALVAALTASGLPTNEFLFCGFLPPAGAKRARRLQELLVYPRTVVIYESPFRIEKLLADLTVVAPSRRVVVARELTKRFEEFLGGSPPELLAALRAKPRKGEFVVVVGPEANGSPSPRDASREDDPSE